MSPIVGTLLLFGLLVFFLILGLPLVFVMGGVAVIATFIFWGPSGLYIIAAQSFDALKSFTLISIPLFILMALIMEKSGVAEDLYTAMHRWMGGLRGGLATGTVLICTIFAAMSGISATATVSMGLIALPQMLKRGYDKKIAMGCIMAGGALGILIPPSVTMIIYGMMTGTSIGRLFMGGILPGLLLSGLFIIYITIRCAIQKSLGPPLPLSERANLKQKLVSLKALVLPVFVVLIVLGGMYLGVVTPSEASALGVLGAVVSALIYSRLSSKLVKESCFETAKLSGMVIWIIMGALCFTSLYNASGATTAVESVLLAVPGGKYVTLFMFQIIFFFLGMILDPTTIIMVCSPIMVPIAKSLGFDPVWFGILFVMNMEMAYLTPPFGFNLFYMKAVCPPDVSMGDIYRSVTPFVLIQMLGLIIVVFLPQIALYIPSLMFKQI